jgi:hypothetical protein
MRLGMPKAGCYLLPVAKTKDQTRKLPKRECCESKTKCGRCPLRMLKEGTLPEGYTVKKRKLVRVDGKKVTKKRLSEVA